MSEDLPRLYQELAPWWHLFSDPADYAEEAALYAAALREGGCPPGGSVLELGCGGGNNASHLKSRFRMTLADRSPGMAAMSQRLNPECEHHVGDMRDIRLGRTFDAVFVHDAVMYLTTEADLARAFATVRAHVRPGGCALIAPDFFRETFQPAADHGGDDDDDGERGIRYLEWDHPADPGKTTVDTDYVYALREGGETRVVYDRHTSGIFPKATWRRLAEEAGFAVRFVEWEHSELEPGSYAGILLTEPATARR